MNDGPIEGTDPAQGTNPAQRLEYTGQGVTEEFVGATPWEPARRWVADAVAWGDRRDEPLEPTMLHVATVDAQGRPSLRPVLMRIFDERGPGFYSHLGSRKADDLAGNARVAASLVWPGLFRCLHFRGTAHRAADDVVERYWSQRPYGAQISAVASHQSRPIADRAAVEDAFGVAAAAHPEGEPVPLPPDFAGWWIDCDEVEFWGGRADRLHDRIVFRRIGAGTLADPVWDRVRVQP